jgi:hypothetical protein
MTDDAWKTGTETAGTPGRLVEHILPLSPQP